MYVVRRLQWRAVESLLYQARLADNTPTPREGNEGVYEEEPRLQNPSRHVETLAGSGSEYGSNVGVIWGGSSCFGTRHVYEQAYRCAVNRGSSLQEDLSHTE